MNGAACPIGLEPPRKMPCSLPRIKASYCASAVTSMSRMPGRITGWIFANTWSCKAAERRINATSSSLFTALIASTQSVASTSTPFGRPFCSTCPKPCAQPPAQTAPTVRHPCCRSTSSTSSPSAALVWEIERKAGVVRMSATLRYAGSPGSGVATAFKCAHLHHGHRAILMEHDAPWIAVGRRVVGEPAHKAAQPVVAALHDQRVQPTRLHRRANSAPAARQFTVGDGDQRTLVVVHDYPTIRLEHVIR